MTFTLYKLIYWFHEIKSTAFCKRIFLFSGIGVSSL